MRSGHMLKDLLIYAAIAALLIAIGVPGWVLIVPAIAATSAILRTRSRRFGRE
jgi:hypothetical protein